MRCAVFVLLSVHVILALTSAAQKSCTVDEYNHLRSGYAFWKAGDYTVDPESGNLPKRWAALPSLFMENAEDDPDRVIMSGRIMIIILSLALGLLVFFISREMFGSAGGLISLGLYCFSPSILAHARLVTSDICVALFFIASLYALNKDMTCVRLRSFVLTPLVIAGLLLSKMSGLLILPVTAALWVFETFSSHALSIKWPASKEIKNRLGKAGSLLLLFAIQAVLVVVIVWMFYGFRYEAGEVKTAHEGFNHGEWAEMTGNMGALGSVLEFAKDGNLLPESYLYGLAHTVYHSKHRIMFMNGEHSTKGWLSFFPFCFLVKSPLSLFLFMGLTFFAFLVWRPTAGKGGIFYLLAFLFIYWIFAMSSGLNIGHRHILVTYPVVFILAGSTAVFFKQRKKILMGSVFLALFGFAGESVAIWPHYLAFFNKASGGPEKGYRLLVDSSLDWGQDLPGFRKWLDSRDGQSGEVYLAYFGIAEPKGYGIRARMLPGSYDDANSGFGKIPRLLEPGHYCISATVLQQVSIGGVFVGPWSQSLENSYQRLREEFRSIRENNSSDERIAGSEEKKLDGRLSNLIYENLRFHRLCAWLRQREPDDNVGYSILIYDLSEADLERALDGPSPQLDDGAGHPW